MNIKLLKTLPPTDRHHYSNPRSAGCFVVATTFFPIEPRPKCKNESYNNLCGGRFYDLNENVDFGFDFYEGSIPDWANHSIIYSDRVPQENYKRGAEILGSGCQNWCSILKNSDDGTIKMFAAVIFGLPLESIYAVRIIHDYNKSSGYSIPIIEIIFKK